MVDVIEEQYRRWTYPLPIDDMRAAIDDGSYWEIGDPLTYWPLFWPSRRAAGSMDILVAGCGTNQAAYYALRHPSSRILAVDLSDESLAHETRLKDKHGLDNLTLKKMSLLDVGDLGLDFDFITCTGVLHHLPDPVAGLAALRSVLRRDGVVNVMVYGTSLRLGVYVMQDLFRTMGLEQVPDDIDIIRSVLGTIPQDHVVRNYLKVAPDLDYDSGLVDTFLNRRDRSYYVTEVFDLAQETGLEFLSWCDPLEYSLEARLSADHPAWPKLRDLSERDAAHACDLLMQSRGTHRFALAHPDYVASQRIPMDAPGFLDCTVRLHPAAVLVEEQSTQDIATYRRGGFTFWMNRRLQRMLEVMAGDDVSIGRALHLLDLDETEQVNYLALARSGFASLRSQGHVVVLLPE